MNSSIQCEIYGKVCSTNQPPEDLLKAKVLTWRKQLQEAFESLKEGQSWSILNQPQNMRYMWMAVR